MFVFLHTMFILNVLKTQKPLSFNMHITFFFFLLSVFDLLQNYVHLKVIK